MTERTLTYAAPRQVPYLLGLLASQGVDCPIRHGATGALVAPTSGTLTVTRPEGTEIVAAAAVTITSSVATYTLPTLVTETAGEGWTLVWDLLIGGAHYLYRFDAYLCPFAPHCPISVLDLWGGEGLTELQHRVPQGRDAERGDGTGWQPEVDSAYYAIIQWLLDNGHRPWLIRGMVGLRAAVLTLALKNACRHLAGTDDIFARHEGHYYSAHRAAMGQLRVNYETDSPTQRRAGVPTINLRPTGRARY